MCCDRPELMESPGQKRMLGGAKRLVVGSRLSVRCAPPAATGCRPGIRQDAHRVSDTHRHSGEPSEGGGELRAFAAVITVALGHN